MTPRLGLLVGLVCLAGCGKPAAESKPEAAPPTPAPAPAAAADVEKLERALQPVEWYVNDLPEDAKPRPVPAPVVRSRFERKTEDDFAKLSKVLAETGVPVVVDLGYQGTPATAAWVKHIAGNRMVVGFRATSGCDAKAAIPDLVKMPWLESLELWGESLTDADFAPVAALTNLKSLTLGGYRSKLTRASYATLAGMKELRRFNLALDAGSAEARATDADLAVLAGLTKLESLSVEVDASGTTDAGLARLGSLKGLRSLAIGSGNSQLAGPRTVAAFDAIGGMADLEELVLKFLGPAEGCAKLTTLKKLRKITVQTGNFLGGEPFTHFTRHLGKITSLESIDLEHPSGTKGWTDEALSDIRGLTNLRTLDIGGGEVTDEGLRHLGEMKALTHFWCRANPLTGTGLKHLAGLTQLQVLDLSLGRVTDEGLGELPALPNLRSLVLVRTGITDAGVKHLPRLPKLESLDLMGTGVTDASVPTFTQMPSLRSLDARQTKLTPAAAGQLKSSGRIRSVEIGE